MERRFNEVDTRNVFFSLDQNFRAHYFFTITTSLQREQLISFCVCFSLPAPWMPQAIENNGVHFSAAKAIYRLVPSSFLA